MEVVEGDFKGVVGYGCFFCFGVVICVVYGERMGLLEVCLLCRLYFYGVGVDLCVEL